MSIPYQKAFSGKSSPFMRWSLTPILLLFTLLFTTELRASIEDNRTSGIIITSLLIVLCLAGILSLWGVPFVSRVVSAIIALAFGAYLIDQCFLNFDGEWGFNKSKSNATPINSILAFIVFGIPCLCFTIIGRFNPQRPSNNEDDRDEIEN